MEIAATQAAATASMPFEGVRKRRSVSSRKRRLDSYASIPESVQATKVAEGFNNSWESIDDTFDFSPESPVRGAEEQIYSDGQPSGMRISDSIPEESYTKTSDESTSMMTLSKAKNSPSSLGHKASRDSTPYSLEGDDSHDEWEIEASQPKKKSKSERVLKELYQENDEMECTQSNDNSSDSESDIQDANGSSEYVFFSSGSTKKQNLTARQRAMQLSKAATSKTKESTFKTPNVIPQSRRKPQENTSDLEERLKKADAAHKRRVQAEKAARKVQDEAIKKILGQHPQKHKQKGKHKKQRDDLEKEKQATENTVSNTIRWVSGPSGTVVSFSEDSNLSRIFNSPPSRYPPAREKCAGPSCNNIYRYRDSKSNLPLCSLICYKAIQDTLLSTH